MRFNTKTLPQFRPKYHTPTPVGQSENPDRQISGVCGPKLLPPTPPRQPCRPGRHRTPTPTFSLGSEASLDVGAWSGTCRYSVTSF